MKGILFLDLGLEMEGQEEGEDHHRHLRRHRRLCLGDIR